MKAMKLQDGDFNRRSDVERDFTRVGMVSLGELGTANLLENPRTGGQILMFHLEYQNMQQMEPQIRYAKSRMPVNSPYLNKYFDFTTNTCKNPHTGQYWFRHFAEMPKVYLSQALADSRYANVASSSIFLTELLYQIIMAGESLERAGLSHGCISPEYVSFIEPHTFKLAENLNSPSSLRTIQGLILNQKFKYCSPEVFQSVMMGQPLDRINISKHDVFCLGLMIMHMALNFDLNEIYNQDGTFNRPRLKQMKDVFVRKYREMDNRLLAYTVAENMLEMDAGSRLDFKSLKTRLPSLKEVDQFLKKDYELSQHQSCQIYPELENSYLEKMKAIDLSRQAEASTVMGANSSMFFEPIHEESNLKSITKEMRSMLEGKSHNEFVKAKSKDSLLSGISNAFEKSHEHNFLKNPTIKPPLKLQPVTNTSDSHNYSTIRPMVVPAVPNPVLSQSILISSVPPNTFSQPPTTTTGTRGYTYQAVAQNMFGPSFNTPTTHSRIVSPPPQHVWYAK